MIPMPLFGKRAPALTPQTTSQENPYSADKACEKTGDSIEDGGLIPLNKAHYLPQSTGRSASRLGQLIAAGFNVPDGFVVSGEIINRTHTSSGELILNRAEVRTLNRLWRKLKTRQVAVWGSAANQDSKHDTITTHQEAVPGVSRHGLHSAINTAYRALTTQIAVTHPKGASAPTPDQDGVVVVQKMVPAEFSGVMFTEHPRTTGMMLVEMSTGAIKTLSTGSISPDAYSFGKLSGELLENESNTSLAAPINLGPLLALGRELEALFGQAQNVEWIYAKGTFFLTQVRDIKNPIANGSSLKRLAEAERRNLLLNLQGEHTAVHKGKPDEPAYVRCELSGLHPRPTPLSADLLQRVWSAGGSIDLACRDLGLPYDVQDDAAPCTSTIFGWMYINKREEKRRLRKGAGALASLRLAKNAESTVAHFRKEFQPQFDATNIERNAMAMERLSLDSATSLLNRWVQHFVENTYFVAERIHISASFYRQAALNKLEAAKLAPDGYLEAIEATVAGHAMAPVDPLAVSGETIEEPLLSFGNRSLQIIELAEPHFANETSRVQPHIKQSRLTAEPTLGNPIEALPDNKALKASVKRAREFIQMNDEARHYCLIELAQIRQLLLAIDNKLQLAGRVFQLTIDEVVELANPDSQTHLIHLADKRFETAMACKPLKLPESLSLRDLERIDMITGEHPVAVSPGELSGKSVAAEQEVVGPVRVITDAEQIHTFKPGEILVVRMAEPRWYPLFARAQGVITEVGGCLSHGAMRARELNLPLVVGVNEIFKHVQNGDVIRMSATGSLQVLTNRRSSDSPQAQQSTEASCAHDKRSGSDARHELHDLYQLNARKMFSFSQRMERRSMKHRITDKHPARRVDANGQIQFDQHLADRRRNTDT